MSIHLTKRKTVLFLLRAYNDIDHFTPIMWKLLDRGTRVVFAFVAADYANDYRIKFLISCGAEQVKSNLISRWAVQCRPNVRPRVLRSVTDRVVALTFGLWFLFRHSVRTVVNEWSGPYGRELAPYFLRPAHLLGLPVFSLPHGYHIYTTHEYNPTVAPRSTSGTSGPDFSSRNRYTKYVVQSRRIYNLCKSAGIEPKRLVMLGSARFCKEWAQKNAQLVETFAAEKKRSDTFTVLLFLGNWNYNIRHELCFELIRAISAMAGVHLIIKGHTRGRQIGGLTVEDQRQIESAGSVTYASDDQHSTALIAVSDFVVSYGSSILFEAMLQGKPSCNAAFVSSNPTIFDGSGAVFDAHTVDDVIDLINEEKAGLLDPVVREKLESFLKITVNGEMTDGDVLASYADLISSYHAK